MLSRVAESLYWIGRYVERAEDTSRLLDVHVHAVLEDPWVDEVAACRDLLGVMGVDGGDEEPDVRRTTDLLAFRQDDTSSIVGALVGAWQNARGVREVVSSELWECLNATFHALPARREMADRYGLDGFFHYIRDRTALVAGLVDGTMPRDDGWQFLVLGRSLERVDMTARLLWARAGRSGASGGWVKLLRSCSAYEAYLRTYRGGVDAGTVVEFLVLDRLFPRSIYAGLAQAEQCLVELSPAAGRAGVDDDALRLLGRARTDLQYRVSDELGEDLPALLEAIQRTCADVGDAVTRRYFRRRAAIAWAAERGA